MVSKERYYSRKDRLLGALEARLDVIKREVVMLVDTLDAKEAELDDLTKELRDLEEETYEDALAAASEQEQADR